MGSIDDDGYGQRRNGRPAGVGCIRRGKILDDERARHASEQATPQRRDPNCGRDIAGALASRTTDRQPGSATR